MYLWLILLKCVTTSNVNIYCFLQGFILLYCFVIYIYIYYILNSQPMFFSFFFSIFASLSTGLGVDSFLKKNILCGLSWIIYKAQYFFFFHFFFSSFSNLNCRSSAVNTCNGSIRTDRVQCLQEVFAPTQMSMFCCFTSLNHSGCNIIYVWHW